MFVVKNESLKNNVITDNIHRLSKLFTNSRALNNIACLWLVKNYIDISNNETQRLCKEAWFNRIDYRKLKPLFALSRGRWLRSFSKCITIGFYRLAL